MQRVKNSRKKGNGKIGVTKKERTKEGQIKELKEVMQRENNSK